MKKLMLTLLLSVLVATPTLARDVVLGAFLPMQTPALDQIVRGKNADDYFMPAWRAYKRGQVVGAVTDATIFLWTGDQQTPIFRGQIKGHQYVQVDRSVVSSDTKLCVKIPGAFVAHQQQAAGPGMMCQAGIDRDIRRGYGTSEKTAIGVIAIVPSGS